jgi:hypothetical protein
MAGQKVKVLTPIVNNLDINANFNFNLPIMWIIDFTDTKT